MSEEPNTQAIGEEVISLRARAEALERTLADVRVQSQATIIQLELKAEATRAGMLDLDGLKLIDPTTLTPGDDGEFRGAHDAIAGLKRDKPYLFGGQNSSSIATPPAPAIVKRKLATEMSLDEWRAARADLLRRR